MAAFLGRLVNSEGTSLESIKELVFLGVVLKLCSPGAQDGHLGCSLNTHLAGVGWPPGLVCPELTRSQDVVLKPKPGQSRQSRMACHPTTAFLGLARAPQSAFKQTVQGVILLNIQKLEIHCVGYGNELLTLLGTGFWRHWENLNFHLFWYVWFCLELK